MKIVGIGDIHADWVNPVSRIDNYPQAVLKKLEWVGSYCRQIKADLVVQSGDWWHRKLSPLKEYENALIAVLRTFPCPIYSVSGNHDQYYCQATSVNRTPLGTLFNSGVVQAKDVVVTDDGSFFDIYFQNFAQSRKPIYPGGSAGRKTMLVAHQYWAPDFPFAPEESWDPQDVEGYNYVFLGHDHTPYDPVVLPNRTGTVLIRPGSLTRGTQPVSVDKFDRAVRIFTLDTSTSEMCHVDVPVAPATEVFSVQAVEQKTAVKSIRDFVKGFEYGYIGDDVDVAAVVREVCPEVPVQDRVLQHFREKAVLV